MSKTIGIFFGSTTPRTTHSRQGGFDAGKATSGKARQPETLTNEMAKRASKRCGGCR